MNALVAQGLSQLGLDSSRGETLCAFARLLLEKNKVMNLTAITEPEAVATLHLLDCAQLLLCADWHGKRVVDVGTGAGFPGMPLRILEDDFDLTLLDSLGKRILFLEECCQTLRLRRVRCVHGRAEEFAAAERERYDIATARAVAALPVLAELCLPLVKVDGCFLAMKSVECDEELRSAQSALRVLGGTVEEVIDYTIFGTEVTHRIIKIRKTAPSPAQYPRPFAKIKKQPL